MTAWSVSLILGACGLVISCASFYLYSLPLSLPPSGFKWYGVDIRNEDINDNFEACVWEPAMVKINALTAASEAAALILSVDETIKNPKSGANNPPDALPGPRGRGRGKPF